MRRSFSVLLFTAIFLSLYSFPVLAQSAAAEESRELMSWLPDADYLSEGFWYLDVDPALPAYPMYEMAIINNPRLKTSTMWPAVFTKHVRAVVIAITLGSREIPADEAAQMMKDRLEGKINASRVTPTHIEFVDTAGEKKVFDIEVHGADLAVLRLDDALATIAAAQAAGVLATTDESLGEGSIYTFAGADGSSGYAALEPDDIMIMASTTEFLRAMHAAGSNEGTRFWDRPENKALWDFIPSLGVMWNNRHSYYYILQHSYGIEHDANREYLDQLENRIALEPMLNFFNIIVGDTFAQENYAVFTDEDTARKRLALDQERFNSMRAKIVKDPLLETETIELKGTVIVNTFTYTRKYVENVIKMRREREAERAKQPENPKKD